MYVPQTTPQQCHNFLTNTCLYIFVYVDLNLLVGVMTFTFSPSHCFYATIVVGGAADRRRRPFLVFMYFFPSHLFIVFALLFSPPPSRSSDPGSHSRLLSPRSHCGSCLALFIAIKIAALSSLVDSRRIVLAHARRSQQMTLFFYVAN